jgi:hypothetical protein
MIYQQAMYDYQASRCKYFPLDDVRISPSAKICSRLAREKNARMPVFIDVSAFDR